MFNTGQTAARDSVWMYHGEIAPSPFYLIGGAPQKSDSDPSPFGVLDFWGSRRAQA